MSIAVIHKVHISVSQIEFDQARQSAQIVIRVFADDLENALSRHTKRQFKLDHFNGGKNREAVESVMGYLSENFELKNKASRPVRLNWAGMETQVELAWLYLEARLPGGLDGVTLRQRIFCELFDDQVNIVNTKHQGKQVGLMFESKDEFKVIAGRAGAR